MKKTKIRIFAAMLMMVQKPQYAPAKDRPPKKEQKIRKLIVVHKKVEATKQDKEG